MWERTKVIVARSLERTLESLLAVLYPGAIAMVAVMALALLAALAVRLAVRRALAGLSFDRRCRQWGFEGLVDWSPGGSPTVLLSRRRCRSRTTTLTSPTPPTATTYTSEFVAKT